MSLKMLFSKHSAGVSRIPWWGAYTTCSVEAHGVEGSLENMENDFLLDFVAW